MTRADWLPHPGPPGWEQGPGEIQEQGNTTGIRLSGIDAARGLALLGMMATHVLPTFESNVQLTPTWVGLVFLRDAPRPSSPCSQGSGWPCQPASSSRSRVRSCGRHAGGVALRALVVRRRRASPSAGSR